VLTSIYVHFLGLLRVRVIRVINTCDMGDVNKAKESDLKVTKQKPELLFHNFT
jgi:hypothetical protein